MSARFIWYTSLTGGDFPARDYEHLLEQVPAATPFNGLAWLAGAEQALCHTQRLHVLTALVENRLVVCLPLISCRERIAGLQVTVIRHLGYPLTDRIVLVVHPQHEEVLGAAFQEIRKRLAFSHIQFSELCVLAGEAGGLKQWRRQVWFSEVRLSCRVPVHEVTDADRQEPSGSLRYKLRRARKRSVELPAEIRRIIPDAQTVHQVLHALSQVEQASWKGRQCVGIFSGEQRRCWMQTALAGMAANGCLRVVSMEHEGTCISYRLGFLDKGRLYDYNLAFLPEFAGLGSGRLLLDEWIRWGLDDGWQWVDASRVSLRDSSHQLHERCSMYVPHYRWTLYSRRPSGLLLGIGYKLWLRLKPWLNTQKTGSGDGAG